MKTKLGIVGCGFLGNIVADAWKKGLLPDYELVGVTSRPFASAEKTASAVGCAACADVDALLALEPEYIVEAASEEAEVSAVLPQAASSAVMPTAMPRAATRRKFFSFMEFSCLFQNCILSYYTRFFGKVK